MEVRSTASVSSVVVPTTYAGLEPDRMREFASTLRSAATDHDEIRTTALRALALADLADHANLLSRLADRADTLAAVAIELEGRADLVEQLTLDGLSVPADLFTKGIESVSVSSSGTAASLGERLVSSVQELETELDAAQSRSLPWMAQQRLQDRIDEARSQLQDIVTDAEAEHARLLQLHSAFLPLDPTEEIRLLSRITSLEAELSDEVGPTQRAAVLATLLEEAQADLATGSRPAVSPEELAVAATAAGIARFNVAAAAPEEWVQPPAVIIETTPAEKAENRGVERNAMIWSIATGMVYGPPSETQVRQATIIVEVNEGNYTRYNQLDETVRADVNAQFGGSPNCASQLDDNGNLMILSQEGTACGVYILEHGDGIGQNTINVVGGWANGVLYDMPRRYSPGFEENVDWQAGETQVGGVAGSISAIPANVASGGWLPVGASALAATDDCVVGEFVAMNCGVSMLTASVNVAALGASTGFGNMLASELDDEIAIALAKDQAAAYVEIYALMPNSVASLVGSEFGTPASAGQVQEPSIKIGDLP